MATKAGRQTAKIVEGNIKFLELFKLFKISVNKTTNIRSFSLTVIHKLYY